MATIHNAEIRPSKLELVGPWLPGQPWAPEDLDGLESVGSFRFDDPDGEVGVETLLLRTDVGRLVQVPLTYRGAPLEGGERWLVGTMEHDALGTRWVYDGCGDPVYVSTLAAVVVAGVAQAEENVLGDDGTTRREPSAQVAGTGHTAANLPTPSTSADLSVSSDAARTVIVVDSWELTVLRRIEDASVEADELALTGTWAGQDLPVRLATARKL